MTPQNTELLLLDENDEWRQLREQGYKFIPLSPPLVMHTKDLFIH